MVQVVAGNVLQPAVLSSNGLISGGLYSAGIMLSESMLLRDVSKINDGISLVSMSSAQIFTKLSMNEYSTQQTHRAVIYRTGIGSYIICYISKGVMVRRQISGIRSSTGHASPSPSVEYGAVGISLDNSGNPSVYALVDA